MLPFFIITIKNSPRILLVLVSVGLLTSCLSVGPRYVPPELEVQQRWATPVSYSASKTPLKAEHSVHEDQIVTQVTERWWSVFTDSTIDQLILAARENNPSLHRAKARIDEAWAQRNVINSGFLPNHNIVANYNIGIGSFGDGLQLDPGQPVGNLAQINHGFDIDVFGRRRRLVESRERNLEVQVEGWRNSYVFFTASVASFYINVRVAEARHELSKEKVALSQKIEDVTRKLNQNQLASDIAVVEASARTQSETAKLARFSRETAIARLALARICAMKPAEVEKLLRQSHAKIPTPPSTITAPFPAQVLRRRPDIRIAERRIAMQVSNLGAELGSFYYQFRFGGAITYESLFDRGVEEILRHDIGGGPSILNQLDNIGVHKHRVAEVKAVLESLVRTYEEQVRQALTEVETALTTIHYGRKELARYQSTASAQKKALEILLVGYKEGLIDIDNLVRVQNEQFESAEQTIFAQNTLANAAVLFYQAVGGGSIPNPPKESANMPVVTKNIGNNPALSTILSMGRDQDKTLHKGRHYPMGRKWQMTNDGIQPAKKDGWIPTSDGLRPKNKN